MIPFVAQHIAPTGQVEVAMAGKIDRRGLVARSCIVDAQRAVVMQRVADGDGHRTRVATLAVAAEVAQREAGAVRPAARLGLPDDLVQARRAAMQMMRPAVARQVVGDSVQAEATVGDAIGGATDQAAEVGMDVQVGGERIEAEQHIGQRAAPVRRLQPHQRGAMVCHAGHQASRAAQREQLHLAPVSGMARPFAGHTPHRVS